MIISVKFCIIINWSDNRMPKHTIKKNEDYPTPDCGKDKATIMKNIFSLLSEIKLVLEKIRDK